MYHCVRMSCDWWSPSRVNAKEYMEHFCWLDFERQFASVSSLSLQIAIHQSPLREVLCHAYGFLPCVQRSCEDCHNCCQQDKFREHNDTQWVATTQMTGDVIASAAAL